MTTESITRSSGAIGSDPPAVVQIAGRTRTTAWLRATGLTKRYGERTVLDGVDLTLDSGSFVVLAGRNGAGKSTLLGCLAGALRHEGSVLLGDLPLGRQTRGSVSYLPQRLRLPAQLSGREILGLFRALGRPGGPEIAIPAGFLPPMEEPAGRLSGGQTKRIALAAALAGGPELVLLDEPFANLDDAGRDLARVMLRSACAAGMTVLVASPTALDLLSTAHRVILVEGGRIAFDGMPGAYAGRLEIVVWVRAGSVPADVLAGLAHVLAVRPDGDWLALTCHEDRSVDLLQALEGLGVRGDQVRLGGPAGDPRFSSSPDRPPEVRP